MTLCSKQAEGGCLSLLKDTILKVHIYSDDNLILLHILNMNNKSKIIAIDKFIHCIII